MLRYQRLALDTYSEQNVATSYSKSYFLRFYFNVDILSIKVLQYIILLHSLPVGTSKYCTLVLRGER